MTLGVTMLAKRNGHDPPPQHSRSRPPESPLGVARVGGGVLSADRTHAPVVIRALGGLLTILPRAVNRAVRLICACHLFILRLVTLLCGTTYTTPQAATAVSGPEPPQCEDWYGAFATCYASLALRTPAPP